MAKNKGGRPKKINKEVLQKLEEGFLKGLTDRECCLYANIAPGTLYNYCNEHPEFLERKEVLKDNIKVKAKINLAEAIEQGDMDKSMWYLERKCKDEFSLKQEVQMSGDINNPMAGLTTEELKKLINDG